MQLHFDIGSFVDFDCPIISSSKSDLYQRKDNIQESFRGHSHDISDQARRLLERKPVLKQLKRNDYVVQQRNRIDMTLQSDRYNGYDACTLGTIPKFRDFYDTVVSNEHVITTDDSDLSKVYTENESEIDNKSQFGIRSTLSNSDVPNDEDVFSNDQGSERKSDISSPNSSLLLTSDISSDTSSESLLQKSSTVDLPAKRSSFRFFPKMFKRLTARSHADSNHDSSSGGAQISRGWSWRRGMGFGKRIADGAEDPNEPNQLNSSEDLAAIESCGSSITQINEYYLSQADKQTRKCLPWRSVYTQKAKKGNSLKGSNEDSHDFVNDSVYSDGCNEGIEEDMVNNDDELISVLTTMTKNNNRIIAKDETTSNFSNASSVSFDSPSVFSTENDFTHYDDLQQHFPNSFIDESVWLYGTNDHYDKAHGLYFANSNKYSFVPACASPHAESESDNSFVDGDDLCEDEQVVRDEDEIPLINGLKLKRIQLSSIQSIEDLFLNHKKLTDIINLTKKPSVVPPLFLNHIPKLQKEMTRSSFLPTTDIMPFNTSSPIVLKSDREDWISDLVSHDSQRRRDCCTRCRSDCTIWEVCRPAKCIIDQNEIEILQSRNDGSHRHRRPLNEPPRVQRLRVRGRFKELESRYPPSRRSNLSESS